MAEQHVRQVRVLRIAAVEGERAVKRAVKAPRRNGSDALVEEGLQPGERVVVYPSDALRDGAKVRAR